MKTFALTLAALSLSPNMASAADATPVVGKMLYSTGGKKLAPVYKLDSTSAPQIMLEGKLITIPAATLTEVEGRIETSLTKKDLMTRR